MSSSPSTVSPDTFGGGDGDSFSPSAAHPGDLKYTAVPILGTGLIEAQPGWYVCNHAEASRSTDANLYAEIGDTYGAGDGVTTFNLPDFLGRTAVVYADGGHPDVNVVGATEGEPLGRRRPKHAHLFWWFGGASDNPSVPGASTGESAGASFTSPRGFPNTPNGMGDHGDAPIDAPAYLVVGAALIKR